MQWRLKGFRQERPVKLSWFSGEEVIPGKLRLKGHKCNGYIFVETGVTLRFSVVATHLAKFAEPRPEEGVRLVSEIQEVLYDQLELCVHKAHTSFSPDSKTSCSDEWVHMLTQEEDGPLTVEFVKGPFSSSDLRMRGQPVRHSWQ